MSEDRINHIFLHSIPQSREMFWTGLFQEVIFFGKIALAESRPPPPEERAMLKSVLAALFVAVVSTGAVAQEFQFEAPPLFDNCGDPSLAKAKTDGVTLGFSPSPPYSSLDPATKQ